ncbi:MAG: hypothetical protein ACO1N0_15800 [Fluviicola sp.]
MYSIFLRAKHWQLFIPLMVIPFVTMIIFGVVAAFTIYNLEHHSRTTPPEDAANLLFFIPVILILCSFIQFAWFWNVFTKLSKLVPDHVRLPLGRIKFFFIFPILYFCALPFYIVFVIHSVLQRNETNLPMLALLGILVLLLYFFCIFCMIHTMYFSAKIIRSAELQRDARFSTFVGYFFLIWIFPVGIWFIQPKINALINKADRLDSSNRNDLVDRL